MTTKTDITLPPLPMPIRGSAFVRGHAPDDDRLREWGRAAVEADRQGRMPSDEEILALLQESGALATTNGIKAVRAALSRYSSGQPAAVRCNHCGWHGADADLVREVAADEPEDGAADVCPRCKRIGDLQDIGQPAANAEPTESAVLLDALSGLVKALRERHYGRMPDEVQAAYDKAWAIVFSSPVVAQAQPVINQQMTTAVDQSFVNMTPGTAAPVAQEPVAFLCRECDEEGWSTYAVMPNERPPSSDLMHVTPLYAAPVATQAQPSGNAGELDERAAFEWWASDEGESPLAIERDGNGNYKLAQIQSHWDAWQARAALAAQPSTQDHREDAANMFWDADEPETCEDSIHNVIVAVMGYRSVDVGDVVDIQRAIRLPDIRVRITAVEDDGNGDLEYEVVDAARAAKGVDHA